MGLEDSRRHRTNLALSPSKGGSAHHPWFDKLTMGLEDSHRHPNNLALSPSKGGSARGPWFDKLTMGLVDAIATTPTSP